MGRRKKEEPAMHRAVIANAAEVLFRSKGVEAATMDEIAEKAGYSKATLYVYFKNKRDIVGFLTLRGMERLYACVVDAVALGVDTKACYGRICKNLVEFERQDPFSFRLSLKRIPVNVHEEGCLEVEKEIFKVGEKINGQILAFLKRGMEEGSLHSDLKPLHTVFLFWASLSGIILMAEEKQPYLRQILDIGKQEFLEEGFGLLFRSIEKGEKSNG